MLILIVLLSMPVVSLIGVVRAGLCIVRCRRARHLKFTIFSILCVVFLLVMLATVVVVWFAYAVAHTGKDASSDLIVLASTITPVYAGSVIVWRFSLYMERRLYLTKV